MGKAAVTVATFKKTVTAAGLAGILAGLLLTWVQQIHVVPLILEAEAYERASEIANGSQRDLLTAAANIVLALGFALLLGAAVALRGAKLDWRSGLLWGLGGYAVFFVAPSLGLPPEVPGIEAAELAHRQVWWAATSIFTATGLSLMVFSGRRATRILGAALLIVPHLIGAPQPEAHGGTAPAELSQAFVLATALANAVFWLGLGGLYGFFHERLATD